MLQQPTDVKDPEIKPLVEQDADTLEKLLTEIPLWVKNPDYDCMDWLNKFIANMWPFLDKAICKTVKDIATPIIAEQIPKYKIDSVEFEKLTLGSLPPTFQASPRTFDSLLVLETLLGGAMRNHPCVIRGRNKALIHELGTPRLGSKDLQFNSRHSQSFLDQTMACL